MQIELNIPDSKSGNYNVHNFEVTDEMASKIKRYADKYEPGRELPPGKYVRLMRRNDDDTTTCVMSNTPAEIKDHEEFINMATGDILINGLGLGMCVQALLKKESVKSITIIEKSWDVIRLIRSSLSDKRITVIQADAFEFKPTEIYDFVWHDIWDHVYPGNLEGMHVLFEKYRSFSAWQGAWALDLCIDMFNKVAQVSRDRVAEIRRLYKNQCDIRMSKHSKRFDIRITNNTINNFFESYGIDYSNPDLDWANKKNQVECALNVITNALKTNLPRNEATLVCMTFDPETGFKIPDTTPELYRENHGGVAWLFNPWSGEHRDPRDIGSDVFGLLMVAPGEHVKAMENKLETIGRTQWT